MLWVSNVFDETELTSHQGGSDPVFSILGVSVQSLYETYGAPRTFGIQLTARFF